MPMETMKRLVYTILCILYCLKVSAQYVSEVWVGDRGNGTYHNPILHADYSDPDVCAVGDDFYMTASSFGCAPGLPILHSKDLVNWELINHALREIPPVEHYQKPRHGKGVWAPCIRYHAGEFYIYWGDPDHGIYMVKTTDPRGKWDKPVLVKGGQGMIDPTPLWDEDGKVYLAHAWAASRSKMNSIIVVCEMNAEGTAVVSNPVLVYDGNDGVNHTVEGPKLYKRDGWYYIFAPAGGVEKGWQLAMRSKSIYGPYEARRVMEQGDTDINGPHQGGWVDTPSGESWFIHFQEKSMYGRIIHLNPITWHEGWPIIGEDKDVDGCGNPVRQHTKPKINGKYPKVTPVESDEFNKHILGPQWQWHANYQDTYGFTSDLGYLRLYGHVLSKDFVNFWEVPNLLMQKFPAESFTATTKLKVSAKADGQQSGLIVMGRDYSYLAVVKEGDGFVLRQAICKNAEDGTTERIVPIGPLTSRSYKAGLRDNYETELYLRVKVTKGGVCHFSYSTDGKRYTLVGEAFTSREGKWIGAKVGLFSTAPNDKERGWVDADWFRITK